MCLADDALRKLSHRPATPPQYRNERAPSDSAQAANNRARFPIPIAACAHSRPQPDESRAQTISFSLQRRPDNRGRERSDRSRLAPNGNWQSETSSRFGGGAFWPPVLPSGRALSELDRRSSANGF